MSLILIDTHIWVWWVQGDPRLPKASIDWLDSNSAEGIGVSDLSCWEVAMLASRGRVSLPVPVSEWLSRALAYPGVEAVRLTPRIAVEATQLPGELHRDPVDRILAATARILDCELVTADRALLDYPHIASASLETIATRAQGKNPAS